MKFATGLLVLCCFYKTQSARILATVMWITSSHFLSMLPMLRQLHSNGHEIAVWHDISSDRPNGISSDFTSYRAEVPPEMMEVPAGDPSLWFGDIRAWDMLRGWEASAGWHNYTLVHNRAQFEKVLNEKWDLIISDSIFAVPGIDFSHNPAPLVIFHTTFTELPYSYFRGHSRPLATEIPMYVSLGGMAFSVTRFMDRIYALASNLELLGMFIFPVPPLANAVISKPDFSWSSWLSKSPLGFTDYPDTICWPLPMTLETIPVGTCQNTIVKPLPEELKKFVSDPVSRGTILVALGSVINWGSAPSDRRDAFLGALNRLNEYRIIFAFLGPKLKLPSHILTMDWVPQADILAHEKTKLFVTHGGLKSLKETICNDVPAVFMPIFAEQAMNAFMAKRLGFGGYLDKRLLTEDYVYDEIRNMLDNESALRNVKKARVWWTDKIMDPLELGAFWTEKLLRTDLPDKFFKPRSTKMNLIQSLDCDIIAVLLGFTLAVVKVASV